MKRSIILASAILGLGISTQAQSTKSNQTTKKAAEVKKDAEGPSYSFSLGIETESTNKALKNNESTGKLDQDLKITKAIGKNKSLGFNLRTTTNIDQNAKDMSDVRWSYLQYTNSKAGSVGGRDLTFALRAYLPVGIGINRKGGISQIRTYHIASWEMNKKYEHGFLVSPRIYIGDGTYYRSSLDELGVKSYNSGYRVLATYTFNYKFTDSITANNYAGLYNVWDVRNRLDDNYYFFTDITFKLTDSLSVFVAAEAVHSFEKKGVHLYASDKTIYYFNATTTW